MKYKRSSGILLHPTSLPGPYGIGDLGPIACQWINFLDQAGIGLWEILPLEPTGYGDSPYQCFSAFAGNTYLISPDSLAQEGLISSSDLKNHPRFPNRKMDFARVTRWKDKLFQNAYKTFIQQKGYQKQDFIMFQEKNAFWLTDYSIFMAIKENQNKIAWNQWPAGLRFRKSGSIRAFLINNNEAVQYHVFLQYIFFNQWRKLSKYSHDRNIQIIGDIPLFVAYDSADVWANPKLFDLTETLEPRVVAGVPPDYFSLTGQLWGNPHYLWKKHKKSGYEWWINRFKMTMELMDIIRLDHFRGFGGYWEVPAGNPTAEHGRWVKGPGIPFFVVLEKTLGKLPIIAEDLGIITCDVDEIRDRFEFPGMRIFQFAFNSDADDPFLPHNYSQNCVAYTGTHDNATSRGWYLSAPEKEREYCQKYLGSSGKHIAWEMIRAVWSSVASIAIAPMQDFLELGNEARMNYPGKLGGNWNWRLEEDGLTKNLAHKIMILNCAYGRDKDMVPKPKPIPFIDYEEV